MGGAKNCPETPRQRMIGMMYLVLTAMLALNVSAEIINGFAKIRHSMESSMTSVESRTSDTYAQFEFACNENEAGMQKYGDWYEASKSVKIKCDEFYDYIEKFKLDIANRVSGEHYDKLPQNLKKGGDNTNDPHAYALDEKGESGKTHAEELEDKMGEFCEYLCSVESPCIVEKMKEPTFRHGMETRQAMFRKMFSTEDEINEEGQTKAWRDMVFNEMPAEAVLAVLTKYQNDIRTAENTLVTYFFNAAGSSHFVANKAEALVLHDYGQYIMQGERYRARIVSGMMDTTRMPRVFINGRGEIKGNVYDVVCNEPGEHTLSGYILLPDDENQYPFKETYYVGEPMVSVDFLDAKRYLYIGYNNAFHINVPGKRDNQLDIKTSIPSGISHSDGTWVVKNIDKAYKDADCFLIVYAEDQSGHMTEVNRLKYKVRELPPPHAYLLCDGVEVSGAVSVRDITAGKVTLSAGYGEAESLKAEFTVNSFQVRFPDQSVLTCSGNRFSDQVLKRLKEVRVGRESITIQKIETRYPNGEIKLLTGTYSRIQIDLK